MDGLSFASPQTGQSQAAYNIATSILTMCPVCTKSAVAIRAAIRRRVGQ